MEIYRLVIDTTRIENLNNLGRIRNLFFTDKSMANSALKVANMSRKAYKPDLLEPRLETLLIEDDINDVIRSIESEYETKF
jgi:hypothetical protein